MRDKAWHLRHPKLEHRQWFLQLSELHEMTARWIKEIQSKKPSYVLTRGLNRAVSENLWILESLSSKSLEDFLDEREPEEVLQQLEYMIWTLQAWTLFHLQKNPEKLALEVLFEQISWRLGNLYAKKTWENTRSFSISEIYSSFSTSFLSGYPKPGGFLLRRKSSMELEVGLNLCAHQSPFKEVQPVSDALCRLHSQWMKGYTYQLNPRLQFEYLPTQERCFHRWSFPNDRRAT